MPPPNQSLAEVRSLFDLYNNDSETSYYFEYNGGFVSIYALYSDRDITNPQSVKLFIQPDICAELISQPYSETELLPLWLKVLTSLDDNAPDEIKAEDLKQQFISGLLK